MGNVVAPAFDVPDRAPLSEQRPTLLRDRPIGVALVVGHRQQEPVDIAHCVPPLQSTCVSFHQMRLFMEASRDRPGPRRCRPRRVQRRHRLPHRAGSASALGEARTARATAARPQAPKSKLRGPRGQEQPRWSANHARLWPRGSRPRGAVVAQGGLPADRRRGHGRCQRSRSRPQSIQTNPRGRR